MGKIKWEENNENFDERHTEKIRNLIIIGPVIFTYIISFVSHNFIINLWTFYHILSEMDTKGFSSFIIVR